MNLYPQNAQIEYPCRIFCLLARQAPVGLLVRRGPSRWTQLSLWHTATDEIEYGQWFHGRVPEDRCDLSPDGSLFLYFASKYGRSALGTWTAISRPPYFTALAFWPLGDSWSGGGLFLDEKTLLLNNYPIDHYDEKPRLPPSWLKVQMYTTGRGKEDESIFTKRLFRDGWSMVQEGVKASDRYWWRFPLLEPQILQKCHPDGDHVLLKKYWGLDQKHSYGSQSVYEFSLKRTSIHQETVLEGATWADLDHRQRLVFAKNDGCLYAADLHSTEFSLRVLANLNNQRPADVSTPEWATTWEMQRNT